jgi:hypothetical protein
VGRPSKRLKVTDDVQACHEHPVAVGCLLKKAAVTVLVPFFEDSYARGSVVENHLVRPANLELSRVVDRLWEFGSWWSVSERGSWM